MRSLIRTFKQTFKPQWGPSIVCAIVFVLLLGLGFWQIYRFHFKQHLLAQYQAQLAQSPLSFQRALKHKNLRFLPVKVSGHYMNEQLIELGPRLHNRMAGVDLLTPLEIGQGQPWLLVDRGWVSQRDLPRSLQEAKHFYQVNVVGNIRLLDEYVFILGQNIYYPDQRPLVMQRVEIPALEKIMHHRFYPFMMRLQPHQAGGYVCSWSPINVLPARHMGYAIQWFAMAFVLLLIFLYFCCKQGGSQHES